MDRVERLDNVHSGQMRAVLATMLALCMVDAGRAAENPFDADGFAAWRTLNGGPVTAGWEIVEGVMHLVPAAKRAGGGPRSNHTIVTAAEFGDFTLSFEWRITAGANGGLKYRVRRYGDRQLGCEYQFLDDDGVRQPVAPRQRAGSLYGLYEPAPDCRPKPAGEWNSARIVVRGERIEHWLNGRLAVEATVGDAEWNRRVAESKFGERKGFGVNPRGRLMLTDHGGEVWLRTIMFEPVPADAAASPQAAGR
jgi:hypothetical protein